MSKVSMPSYDEWRKTRYKLFNDKIDSFKNHPKYNWLRRYADDAMSANEDFGYRQIAGADFIDRIESMPSDYIKDWLDNKNQLEWRECDRQMLTAIKGGWVHLIEKYPNHKISRISNSATDFYKEYGYEIITDDDNVYAIKEE